jgi:hypothetical protein
MTDSELVRMTLKGFMKQWTPFIKGIVACENLPDWSRLWDDFVQEELRDEELNGGRTRMMMRTFLFPSRKRRESSRRFPVESLPLKMDKKKDMRKVKCFSCHKFGHYARQCLNKKKGGNETCKV